MKRIILTILLVFAIPVLANAWYVTASASRSAGDTTSRVKPAGQTYIPGFSGFLNVSTIAGAGFQANRVTLDGIALCTNPASGGYPLCPNSTYYTVPYVAGKTYRTLAAYFGPVTVSGNSITVTPDSYTSYKVISPINGLLTNITIGDSRTISIIPYLGYKVGAVTVSPNVCTVADSALYLGAKDVTCSNIQSAIAITVGNSQINQTVTASAGPDQTINGTGAGYAISLAGSATYTIGPVAYAWSAIGANAGSAHFGSPTAAGTTFYADTPGTYTVQLIATAAGPTVSAPDTAVMTVLNTATSLESLCTSCHASRNASVVTDYDNSKHKTAQSRIVVCQTCHDPTNSGHYTDASPVAACAGCHADNSGTVPGHPFSIGAYTCVFCHNPHSTVGTVPGMPTSLHYNNITSAMYPASYVTSRATCMDCHYDSPANLAIRQEWYTSGHAKVTDRPWTYYDFKTRSGCAQCHTTTGFIAYSTGKVTTAWGDSADKTKELLTCIGCHKDITTGTIRTVSPVRPYADDPYTNRNIGESNVCMDCHSGTNNGLSITAKLDTVPPGDFTNQAFINPHYLAAGGTLHGKAGYQFPGRTYAFYSSNSHRLVGMGNNSGTGTGGPCIACHKNAAFGHTFKTGAIPLCANCHRTYLTADTLNDEKVAFTNALEVLKAELSVKGHPYSPSYPYFTNTNWGSGQSGVDNMGAAFNYALLFDEPGAYAHNSAYAKQLIFDSIDYLHNGRITGDISTALASLVNSGAISQQAADNLSVYKAKTSCTACHNSGTTGGHPAHLNDGFSCADCHYATAATNTTLVPDSVTHHNGVVDVVIAPANNGGGSGNFNKATSTCSSVTCHASGPVTWGSGPLACAICHTGTLSVINGITASDKSLATISGHGQPGIGLQCLDCHDRSKRHLGGAGMLQNSLTGAQNTECNYCHSTFAVPNCPDCSGRSACASCHDLHGTTNLSEIRTSILGQSISFTDRNLGFVDTVTNRGFCQVCHTSTAHYRAGVRETDHYTGNCLTCHSPGAAGGAGVCNSCHGYPPAPRKPAPTFGTMNNWSSARFESYSGGGGAHLVAQHVSPAAKPSEGWVNCTLCHNGGKLYHKMVTPVRTHISNVRVEVDPSYRFDDSFTIYTGAKQVNPPAQNVTGSCFNISCHMSLSPRWSTER